MRGRPETSPGEILLPLLPVGTCPILPGSLGVLTLAPPEARALEGLCEGEIALAVSDPSGRGCLPVAVAGRILGSLALEEDRVQLTVRGERRMLLLESAACASRALLRELPGTPAADPARADALAREALRLLDELGGRSLPGGIGRLDSSRPDELPDLLASILAFNAEERRRLLLAVETEQRLDAACAILAARLEQRAEEGRLARQTQARVEKTRRENWLRQQLSVIKEQLGEEDEEGHEYERRIAEARLPDQARAEAQRELRRLRRLPQNSAEAGVARGWLDFATSLPWDVYKASPPPYARVRRALDRTHHGLEAIKERVAEEIAVMRLAGPGRGAILCFAGPPGTGKTSLGKAVAEALGRPYHRIALGGVRDESEIRGHRRTYVGAMPGRILSGLRRAGAADPVFLIDEVDKLGIGFQGDPASALLEVLDPEQNRGFVDHYLGLPFDLSHVVFLATANMPDAIPPALRDRMEILQLPGYTDKEKVTIAARHLLPAALEACGLPPAAVRATRPALQGIVRRYTREAGVRELGRALGKIARRAAVARMSDPGAPLRVGARDLQALLGPPRFQRRRKAAGGSMGTVNGLAWTPAGGEILEVEATLVPGSGKEILTGNLGKVMRESAHTALTAVRARHRNLGIRKEVFTKADIHIHFPSGAIPKDGPSAGLAIAAAAASVMSGRALLPGFGLTGELSLRGRVLPVGGLREKLLAAGALGLKRVILPKENEPDVRCLPADVLAGLEIHLVESADEVFELLFPRREPGPKRAEPPPATPPREGFPPPAA